MAMSGVAFGLAVSGALLVYSGLTGKGFLSGIQSVVQGKSPALGSVTSPIGGTSTTAAPGTYPSPGNGQADTSSGMQALQLAAANRGWNTGAEWTALNAIEMQEAGYNPLANNGSSGAYGLAQSLGHKYSGGPAPNGVNEYGGEGLTPAESEQASMGNPTYQAIWMVNYISDRYGDPIAAEQFHLANNFY
jgi:trimeric autotransporter adhesin